MKNLKRIKNRSFFFLISFLFLTSLLSIKTLKKVNKQDIRISGSELFSQNDVIKNSSLNFPIRLIFIETNFLEKELKQNLSLKNVSVIRQIFPFGLKIEVNTRTPIAYGEKIFNDTKIPGFIDKDGELRWSEFEAGNFEEKDSFTIKKLELVELMALTSGEAPLTSESQGKCRLRLVGDGKEMDVPFSDAEQAREWMEQLMEKARCDL